MGNEPPVGYAVLDLRISETEKDVKELAKDFKEHIRKNDDEHKEMRQNIAESSLSVREIKLMQAHSVSIIEKMEKSYEKNSKEIKEELKSLHVRSDKETGWRAIIIDILKVMALIIGFIATGKFIL
ncbi:hypothetical protein FQ085_11550 [Planococcus sp. ANT_H30]|uniref:hypothetical protein n=1 Tax=Planococcus sp. ANT_H30 TaxID=2597347 RepID=UPI0011ED8B82|nr:hypothetical protein [Planococcus sp. ANT_H30]KAA0956622.1 hypothetical protein FQ085_11550 [Planococcus sp. ANT_H30]